MSEEKIIKKEMTLDDLALMVAKGFNDMDEKMDRRFKEVNEKIDKGFKEVYGKMDEGFREAKVERENIEANLNKKVDKIEYNTLTYRVEKLEKKFV